MTEDKKITYLRTSRPITGGIADITPSGVTPHPTRYRNAHSYSDATYEWAVYRSKGKSLSEYHSLPNFESNLSDHHAYFNSRNKVKSKSLAEIKRLREASVEARRFERHFFQSINAAVSSLRVNLYSGLSYVLFENYFYKNVLFYWFVWFNFYIQEYVYLNLSLYFPVLDWLTTNVFFVWPVHVDLYFLRFVFSVFSVFVFVFLYFQYRFKQSSIFDILVAGAHFFVFFGSIAAYHVTGAAPFLFLVSAAFLFFFIFNFFYFIPRTLVRHYLNPPLLISAPVKEVFLMLSAPRYRYPFAMISAQAGSLRTRFTAFPFTTKVDALARHQRFVRTVLHHSFVSPDRRSGVFKGSAPVVDRKLSLANGSFDTFYNFNPYDYYEDRVKASYWRSEDYTRFIERNHEEDDFTRQENYAHIPLSMNNVSFFSAGFRRNALSLYRGHFTGQFDTFGASFAPRPPSWQLALIGDPYFKLYIWLKNVAPLYGRMPPRSKFYRDYWGGAANHIGPSPYPRLSAVLHKFYGFFEHFFDHLTFHYFTLVPRSAGDSIYSIYAEFIKLDNITSKFTFSPSKLFLKSLNKFLLSFECRLDSRSQLLLFLSSNKTVLFELFTLVDGLSLNLIAMLQQEIKRAGVTGSAKQLHLRLALRTCNRLLIKFVACLEFDPHEVLDPDDYAELLRRSKELNIALL